MEKNMFNLICIEGADKTGKTTLSNEIQKSLDNVHYYHFTTSSENVLLKSNITLQKNVNVLYQFFDFFNKHIYNNLIPGTFLLDRTLYSDIIYGPMYRGLGDKLVVRPIEKNYFTLLLQGLNTIFIFANNSDREKSYQSIKIENEGLINSLNEYDFLRNEYSFLMKNIEKTSTFKFIEYDFNKYEHNVKEFVDSIKLNNHSELFNELVKQNALGQIIGNIEGLFSGEIDELYYVGEDDLEGEYPITIQDFANLVSKTGSKDYSKDSPLMYNNNYCIVRKGSTAEFILNQFNL